MKLLLTFRSVVSALLLLLITSFYYLHHDVSQTATYIKSENCASCHESIFQAWQQHTLHPHMFRPINSSSDIKGDFSDTNPALTFKKEDIEFVIGNKWEQVYARMIEGEYYPLPAKWLITTQKWVPYKVNNWRQTPLSTQCNGCHTTGFNSDTYQFSEYGIGCEACHGPGSMHVQTKKQSLNTECNICHNEPADEDQHIIVSVKNSVCGQCHSRGQQTIDNEHIQTSFRFPLNVTPGDDLPKDYKPLTQALDKKKKFWWDNGLSKNRHQEFADFSVSKHSLALKLLKEKHTKARGELTDECLSCHSADYILAKNKQDITLQNAQNGLTCVVCHEPHGLNRKFKHMNSDEHRCGLCHADSISINAAKTGKAHIPCPPSSATCADCHMPYIVKSGGSYPIRSHAFKIVPPMATQKYDIPNSCQNGGCHENKSLDWAINNFQAYYPNWQDKQ